MDEIKIGIFLRRSLIGQNKYLTINWCNATFITKLGHRSQCFECELYETNLALSKICTDLSAVDSCGLLVKKGKWVAALQSKIGAWGSHGSLIFEER